MMTLVHFTPANALYVNIHTLLSHLHLGAPGFSLRFDVWTQAFDTLDRAVVSQFETNTELECYSELMLGRLSNFSWQMVIDFNVESAVLALS